jgi:hypothetical protein
LELWLEDLPRQNRLINWNGSAPKPGKGELPVNACVRLEAQVHELKDKIAKIKAAPLTADEAKTQIAAFVDDMSETVIPDLSSVLSGGGPASIVWPKDRLSFQAVVSDGKPMHGSVPALDPLALCAWLDPAALIERLCAEIEALDDGSGIPADDRKKALEKAEADLLTAERTWEHWISDLESKGEYGFRRRDADPRAVLGVIVEGGGR